MGSSISYQLTERQHELVTRFLVKSAYDWRFLDSKARSQSIYQLKQAIHERLDTVYESGMNDEEFTQVLESIHVKPSGWIEMNVVEEEKEPDPIPVAPEPPSSSAVDNETEEEVEMNGDGIILGVCDSWAEQLKMVPYQIRTVWVLAGLVTGPFAVTAYVFGYIERVVTHHLSAPKRSTLNKQSSIYFVSGVIIWLAAQAFRKGIYLAGGTFTDGVLVLGEWDWIRYSGNTFSFWILFSLLSLSLLLALPCQSRSRIWIKNSARVILIAYAILMSYGMGRLLTGFLMRTTEL